MAASTESVMHDKYRQEITAYGYIRQCEHELENQIIPDGIFLLILQYYLYVKFVIFNQLTKRKWVSVR